MRLLFIDYFLITFLNQSVTKIAKNANNYLIIDNINSKRMRDLYENEELYKGLKKG